MISNICYTIGHSNHPVEKFLELLEKYNINVVVDARSVPYSKYAPQFNKKNINQELNKSGIDYIFMGNLIGGIINDPKYFKDGKVDLERLRNKPSFKAGINWIIQGIENNFIITVMCSEKDPLACHRFHFISKELKLAGIGVKHILENGEVKSQEELEMEDSLKSTTTATYLIPLL
jgi:uncharacterized protein (DUF488 family)